MFKILKLIIGVLVIVLALLTGGCLTYFHIKQKQALPEHIQKVRENRKGLRFSVRDLKGSPLSVSDFSGQVVLINFWATWCAPCVEELSSLNNLAGRQRDSLVVLAVSNESAEEIKDFLKAFPKFHSNFIPSVVSREKMLEVFAVKMLPETYILDRKGFLKEKIIGPQEWDSKEWLKKIKHFME